MDWRMTGTYPYPGEKTIHNFGSVNHIEISYLGLLLFTAMETPLLDNYTGINGISFGLCLECYTCVRQDNNKDKCIKTTIQCEEYENGCYSQIRWGIPPYWKPHGDRIYFIDKGCMRYERCLDWQVSKRHTCRRDWYLDWECVECCRGDMCNYYVTVTPLLEDIGNKALVDYRKLRNDITRPSLLKNCPIEKMMLPFESRMSTTVSLKALMRELFKRDVYNTTNPRAYEFATTAILKLQYTQKSAEILRANTFCEHCAHWEALHCSSLNLRQNPAPDTPMDTRA
ncbi:hypothetical protein LSH36_202g00026 [Paralvinella palmiformis]|uniref:Uncharacterized protein n=1 Tax=Paralvinella palmiformis TaxID=53620 RepID=A0AAD9N7F1_9ANNE|nr:hypothetical protein LSH36_202g00026 [Paralvinella palmiformis]